MRAGENAGNGFIKGDTMKIKRFAVERIPVEVEYIRPITGRLFLFFNFYRFVKLMKINTVTYDKRYDTMKCGKPIYRLYIPKVIANA